MAARKRFDKAQPIIKSDCGYCGREIELIDGLWQHVDNVPYHHSAVPTPEIAPGEDGGALERDDDAHDAAAE